MPRDPIWGDEASHSEPKSRAVPRPPSGKVNGHAPALLPVAAPSAPKPSPLKLTWFHEIQPCLDVMDFVQGVLVEKGGVVLYGESGAGKTFWFLDLALHVAAGKKWNGRRVEQGGVVYCVLEGSALFRNRVVAWRGKQEMDGQKIPFADIESSLNLLDPKADMPRLIDAIKEAAAQIDVPVKLVVIDTLSRALAGGNENSPDDMGALVLNMDAIRAATGACVAFVHHSGKDQAKGARGHNLLRCAIDTEIEVVGPEGVQIKTATVAKQRDLKKGDVFPFQLETVVLGQNRYQEDVTSCVISAGDAGKAGIVPIKKPSLTNTAKVGLQMLQRAFANFGTVLPPGPDYPPNTAAVTTDHWRQTYYDGAEPGEKQDTKSKSFRRACAELLAKGVISSVNDYVWFVHPGSEGPQP